MLHKRYAVVGFNVFQFIVIKNSNHSEQVCSGDCFAICVL